LYRAVKLDVPEDMEEAYAAHKSTVDDELNKVVATSFRRVYKENEDNLKDSLDTIHKDLYLKFWSEKEATIKEGIIKLLLKYKDQDARTFEVKIPEQLEDAYLHHKNEIVREVKGDVHHMLEDFKYDEHKAHFHHGEHTSGNQEDHDTQTAAKDSKPKSAIDEKNIIQDSPGTENKAKRGTHIKNVSKNTKAKHGLQNLAGTRARDQKLGRSELGTNQDSSANQGNNKNLIAPKNDTTKQAVGAKDITQDSQGTETKGRSLLKRKHHVFGTKSTGKKTKTNTDIKTVTKKTKAQPGKKNKSKKTTPKK